MGTTYLPTSFRGGPVAKMAASNGMGRAVWAVLAVLIAPPVEELLFRGVMLRGMIASWGGADGDGVRGDYAESVRFSFRRRLRKARKGRLFSRREWYIFRSRGRSSMKRIARRLPRNSRLRISSRVEPSSA